MNPELAYTQHTDLARALGRPDEPARTWLDTRLGSVAGNDRTPLAGQVTMADPLLIARMVREGHESARVQVVIRWDPDGRSDPLADDELVGVLNPEVIDRLLPVDPDDDTAEALGFPFEMFTDVTIRAIASAPTFYVTADMCRLLDHAARSIDETDLMPDHPRYRSGFAVLAEPLEIPYGNGVNERVSAFSWADYGEVLTVLGVPGRAGLAVQYTDRRRHGDDPLLERARLGYPSKSAWQRSPDLIPVTMDQYVTGSPVGTVTEHPTDVLDMREAYYRATGRRPDGRWATPVQPVGRFQPYLAAFLLLLAQQITAPRDEPVHPATARRAREVAERRSSAVTVVDLRRRAHGTAGGGPKSGRRLKNRHLVEGYWKWQPYGPERRLRKRIYIEDYTPGPKDAPLVIKPRVRRL